METLNRLPFKARKAVFEKLEKIVDIAALSKEEREKYDESIKVYRDNLATMTYATEKGLADGRAEGLAEGRAEGLAEGRAKGRTETMTNVARNLKAMGLDTASICKATNLTVEAVEQL